MCVYSTSVLVCVVTYVCVERTRLLLNGHVNVHYFYTHTYSHSYACNNRYYFQMLATEVLIAGGFYGIIRNFQWKRVGVISQNENLFTEVCGS